jgi:CDP-diacylglycerol--glycerol-3-phosphate 3-phosphatidyltransferase
LTTNAVRRVPHLNWANFFTFLRVALVPLFAWLLAVREPSEPIWAAIVFAAAAATDGVDGYVARRWDLVSGFGQSLDPLADKLLVGTALVALALDARIPWWAVVVILAREFIVGVGLRAWLGRTGRALPASNLGKVKTAMQILAVLLLTTLEPGNAVALAALYAAVTLTLVSGALYLKDALRGRAGVTWR